MKSKTIFVCVILASFMLMSCYFAGEPYLLSIKFVDDKTIEYEFPLVSGNDGYLQYSVRNCSITPKDGYKISLRSNDYVNVSDICLLFGGGGHIRAAGGTINGLPFEKAREKIVLECRKNLK